MQISLNVQSLHIHPEEPTVLLLQQHQRVAAAVETSSGSCTSRKLRARPASANSDTERERPCGWRVVVVVGWRGELGRGRGWVPGVNQAFTT